MCGDIDFIYVRRVSGLLSMRKGSHEWMRALTLAFSNYGRQVGS